MDAERLGELAALRAAAAAVVAVLRVDMGPWHGVWCRACGASWGADHAEASPRCPVPALLALVGEVKP